MRRCSRFEIGGAVDRRVVRFLLANLSQPLTKCACVCAHIFSRDRFSIVGLLFDTQPKTRRTVTNRRKPTPRLTSESLRILTVCVLESFIRGRCVFCQKLEFALPKLDFPDHCFAKTQFHLTHKPRNDLQTQVYIRKSPFPNIFRS